MDGREDTPVYLFTIPWLFCLREQSPREVSPGESGEPYLVEEGALALGYEGHQLTADVGEGVCVVVCDRNGAIGGMCHFLEARAPAGVAVTARYGNAALHKLMRMMADRQEGADLEAFIVGGLGSATRGDAVEDGMAMARDFLWARNVPVVRVERSITHRQTVLLDVGSASVTVERVAGETARRQ